MIRRVAVRRDPLTAIAVAVSVWRPDFSDDVCSRPVSPYIENGRLRSVQRSLPLTRNSTRLIAGVFDTRTTTGTAPETVAPAAGRVNAMVGRADAAAASPTAGTGESDEVPTRATATMAHAAASVAAMVRRGTVSRLRIESGARRP